MSISADEALSFARVLVPEWREHRGCVIRAACFDIESFDRWWASTGGERTRIEGVLNHLHLWDVLPNTDEKDYGELWDLGEIMRSAWQGSLARAFPDARFDVTLAEDYGPTLSCVTVR